MADACVLVSGRGWTGTFAVWGLASMGIGTILWVGQPTSDTNNFANWLLADPSPFNGCQIYDYPFQVEYGVELDWVSEHSSINAFVSCGENPGAHDLCARFCRDRNTQRVAGCATRGGNFGTGPVPNFPRAAQDPIVALAVAALLIDGVREILCPLANSLLPPAGPLGLEVPDTTQTGAVALVGVGGIGVYLAVVLAALNYELFLYDFDRVEESNLNRQGLFTLSDAAEEAFKVDAARRALNRLFPQASAIAEPHRITSASYEFFAQFDAKPLAILSAVDNAQTRLVLQTLGRRLAWPVVQGGTDTFAADCFTQTTQSPALDEQMHGALTAAAQRTETDVARSGGCAADPSYVVPCMMAGALMAHRVRVCRSRQALPPIRWRSGSLPVEEHRMIDVFDFNELTALPNPSTVEYLAER